MKLFVYGTLKRGYGNHRLMHGAEFIGGGFIKDYVVHDFGGCPGIRPSEGVVHGELYEVPYEVLPRIDRLEGHNPDHPERSLYRRTPVRFWFSDEQNPSFTSCETYVYNRYTDAPICPSGEWK